MKDTFKVILGAGESGVGAALLAKAKGFKVFVSELGKISDEAKAILDKNQIVYEEGKHTEGVILQADEIIKSPGIPEKSPIVMRIRDEGIRLISEIEFAARYTQAKIIAITGTNGKTTTTLLTYHLLKNAGFDVGVAGNVGNSFAAELLKGDHDWFVLEVSSFQLDDCYDFQPKIGVLLNITPDHLDRYEKDIQNYVDAKMRIQQSMDETNYFIFNAQDLHTVKAVKAEEPFAKMKPISSKWFDEKAIVIPAKTISSSQTKSIRIDNLPLPGEHNQLNIASAVTAALLAGADVEKVKAALQTFKNVPHRLEKVVEINGITFVNDSKATNVDAVFYALGSYEAPIIWIAGGTDKGNDYKQIEDLVKKNVKALICMGKDNSKIYRFFSGKVKKIADTNSLQDALKKAYQYANKGDVVLLSPACASFDLFKNYEDRGDQFKKACLELAAIENK
jgi:UDP-N-acetylmuramoylalanine--D-glutamate ligase